MQSSKQTDAKSMMQYILSDVQKFVCEAEPHDDMTIVVVQV